MPGDPEGKEGIEGAGRKRAEEEEAGGDAPGGNTRAHTEHEARSSAGELSPGRPMVLCRRRHGRAGGRRNPNKRDKKDWIWQRSERGALRILMAGKTAGDCTLKTEY